MTTGDVSPAASQSVSQQLSAVTTIEYKTIKSGNIRCENAIQMQKSPIFLRLRIYLYLLQLSFGLTVVLVCLHE